MYCGQCGKRVLDTMLFCPFCGAPIVIPDQDEEAPQVKEEVTSVPEQPVEVSEPELVPEVESVEEAEFEPLFFDEEEEKVDEPAQEVDEPERPVSLFDDGPLNEEVPAQLRSAAPEPSNEVTLPRRPKPKRRPEDGVRRSNQTYIPVKDVNVDDIFMDVVHPRDEDEYDPYDNDAVESFGESYSFEEPERGDFLQRHIRGLVGLVLLAMLIVIFLIWALMPKGQKVLATANLAWKADIYGDLGYEAYEKEQYHLAASYFERALARDSQNYEYAHSAMVAYYDAKELDSALSMLKKCIEMNPNDAEPYHEMLILYPNAAERPWEVQELLRQGYERTGDEALNLSAE